MGLILITPPTAPVISIEEAKVQCRVEADETYDDDALAGWVRAAVDQAEQFLNRPLLTTAYRYTADWFPGWEYVPRSARWSGVDHAYDDSFFRLPLGGVSAVTEVGYTDIDGAPVVMDPAQYQVSLSERLARIGPAYQTAWPAARRVLDAVHVDFRAGWGTTPDTIPGSVIAGVKLILGHLYANRESIVIGSTAVCIPMGAEHMLWPHRVFPLRSR